MIKRYYSRRLFRLKKAKCFHLSFLTIENEIKILHLLFIVSKVTQPVELLYAYPTKFYNDKNILYSSFNLFFRVTLLLSISITSIMYLYKSSLLSRDTISANCIAVKYFSVAPNRSWYRFN